MAIEYSRVLVLAISLVHQAVEKTPTLPSLLDVGVRRSAYTFEGNHWINDTTFIQETWRKTGHGVTWDIKATNSINGKQRHLSRLESAMGHFDHRRLSISTDSRWLLWSQSRKGLGQAWSLSTHRIRSWRSSDYLYLHWWYKNPRWTEFISGNGGHITQVITHDLRHLNQPVRYDVPKYHILNKGNTRGFVRSWRPIGEAVITRDGKMITLDTSNESGQPQDHISCWFIDLNNRLLRFQELPVQIPSPGNIELAAVSPNGLRIAWLLRIPMPTGKFGNSGERQPTDNGRNEAEYKLVVTNIEGTEVRPICCFSVMEDESKPQKPTQMIWLPSCNNLLIGPAGLPKAFAVSVNKENSRDSHSNRSVLKRRTETLKLETAGEEPLTSPRPANQSP